MHPVGSCVAKGWLWDTEREKESAHCFQNSAMALSYCVNVFMPDILPPGGTLQ